MFRRLLCFFIAAGLAISLCACTSVKVPLEIENFDYEVKFQSAGTQIKGEIIYEAPESMIFKIKEPENIKDIEFKSDCKSVNVNISEVSFSANIQDESPVYVLFKALEALIKTKASVPLKGEQEIILSFDDEEYRMTIDCENQRLLSIEANGYNYIFE